MTPYFPSKLRIAALPIVKTLEIKRINNTTVISGFEAELINLLSRKLNFEYEILVPTDSSYGSRDASGNWTGMVGMLARNEADMAFALMGITEDRSTVVDFSIPYIPLDKTFLMHHASFLPKTSAFMYPFSTLVWFLFFIVLLLVTMLFRALISPKDSICSVFIILWGSCFRQGINYNPRPMSRRIPLGIWLIYSYVITLSYSSVMLSFLTSPIRTKQIRDFKELYAAVRDGAMDCRAALPTLEAEYLSKSDIPHLKGLGEYIKKNKWYYTSYTNQSVPKHTAMLGSPFLFRLVFGSPQTYFYSKDAFGYFPFGVAIRKDFCCKKRFNTILLRILSGGLYNKFMSDVFFKLDLKKNLNNDFYHSTSASALGLSDLNGVFFVLGVGFAAAVSALILEIIFSRWLCSEPLQAKIHDT
ncbi:probable glutamate receptor [Parasteatoda tepidariorum]|uniref:probable glutamate receptor n=1 Tax=Parasteatoda tepidariorum TaxID=114398 RepID=UPI00077FBBAA|nr:probable glutamate receptor [Parasteatoda tepidariorum]